MDSIDKDQKSNACGDIFESLINCNQLKESPQIINYNFFQSFALRIINFLREIQFFSVAIGLTWLSSDGLL